MTRVLAFPEEPVGSVYVMSDGQAPAQVPAQGAVDVPEGGRAFVMLEQSAPSDLSFLEGVDGDVLAGAQVASVDAAGAARLARQSGLGQLSVAGPLTDEQLTAFGAHCPDQLEVTLEGPAGDGVSALAGAKGLRLHGDPGAALGVLARSTTLSSLHFHTEALGLDQLCALAASTHLEHLDIEVEAALDEDAELVAALVDVACGLSDLGITFADGSAAISPALMVAVLARSPEVSLNGATYTPAAVARMERRLATA